MQTLPPRRRTVVVVLIVAAVPFFAGVNAIVTSARDRRQDMAVEWAQRGDHDLAAGRADAAVDDYRTAQEYARAGNVYRQQLAQALVAGRHLNEARAQLLTLWAEEPGNGAINLQLGRIAAEQGDETEALRAYHAAIDGAWESDAAASRRTARLELARFLIRQGDTTKAQAELIALSDDLPPDPDIITDTATLLVKAGAPQRATVVVEKALALDATNARALRLAGEASFALADYRSAARYLDDAVHQGPLDAQDDRLRTVSTRVLELDPSARGISSRTRVRRVVEAFHIASAWLDRCPPDSNADLRDRVAAAADKVTERDLARDPDLVDDTLALVTEAVAAASHCGAPSADDEALDVVVRPRHSTS